MNITDRIGKEIGNGVAMFLNKTPEIQVYYYSPTEKYHWRDGRKEETCDVWNNESYDTANQIKKALIDHLIKVGDV